jgi:hypothetical protein
MSYFRCEREEQQHRPVAAVLPLAHTHITCTHTHREIQTETTHGIGCVLVDLSPRTRGEERERDEGSSKKEGTVSPHDAAYQDN